MTFEELTKKLTHEHYSIDSTKDITHGKQIKLTNGATINCFNTGKIQVQGKEHLKNEIKSVLGLSSPLIRYDKKSITKNNNKVFVVYGHDTTSREQLELIIHKLGLEPFVLASSSGGGDTIIEALEKEIGKEGNSRLGIVLLTPDDMGYARSEGEEKIQPRARQNVVLELGMLMSAVGRKNTIILKKGHLEVPSDASGIIYLGYNDHVKEVAPKLAKRLKESGFEISADKIANAAS
jgi:predicted nucleotide-binding protein